ncbi:hypothetical protein V1639_07660 [Pseudarthrobacter sp. J75]|uniref:hypothetical protein n=1 Tax=unclassified Pseudarthrobacter TaxID=2647000 RepID=UPI002E80D430|nr:MULTISPECIES: hypothetical protein [unclassified Pseudarthrobacter]MEE2521978.1 hypothetical protein [Pseudarthrobacter sp. J47]MEE2528903.1 hypothetical protein [Pseudarthrobacter sp. J75]MEE2569900.1 hypothetical protein [Pseudarthrobacter sp. J64]
MAATFSGLFFDPLSTSGPAGPAGALGSAAPTAAAVEPPVKAAQNPRTDHANAQVRHRNHRPQESRAAALQKVSRDLELLSRRRAAGQRLTAPQA